MNTRRLGLTATVVTALLGISVLARDGGAERASRSRVPVPGSRTTAARLIPVGKTLPVGAPGAPDARSQPSRAPRSAMDADELSRRLFEREQELRRMGFRHQRSPRNLLSSATQARILEALREKERASADGHGSGAGLFGGGDTLHVRVAAIRVAFNEHGTATAGFFDLRPIWDPDRNDTLMIDPPPHDRAYYLQEYRALDQFWQAMFYGRFKLDYEVFPLSDSDAYVLDSLSYYSHFDPDSTGGMGRAGAWTTEGLVALVKDCLRAADADTAWQFQDYDVYNIIHAGPDYQTDINRDSPDDIPSFYVYFGDTLWTDVTASDSLPVLDATMLPETVSQDGLVGAVNGVFAHEFGHQLGLPDLYNVYTGFPAIGYWDLMDSGPNVAINLGFPVFGALPATLCAYSRYFLSSYLTQGAGFLDVEEVESAWADSLSAVESDPALGSGKVLKVPLTSEEFYLIENRQDDTDGNRATLVGDSLVILEGIHHYTGPDTLTGALYQEKETGVILGPSKLQHREPGKELPPFEEVRTWEYDAGLPGHGILVWHIDEEVLFDLAIDSTGWAPNGNPRRKGVALEEADGIPDLGDFRSFYWQGSPYDPYYAGSSDSLTPTSFPNTNTNLGGGTGLRITEVGGRGHRMFVRVGRGEGEPGFPLFLASEGDRGSAASAIAAGDVNGDGLVDAVMARGPRVFTVLGGVAPGDSVVPAGYPATTTAREAGPLALGDLDGDDLLDIVSRTSDGKLAAWRGDGRPYFDSANPYAVPEFTESLSVAGGPVSIADLDSDGRDEIVAGAGSSLRAYHDEGGAPELVWSVSAGLMSRDTRAEVVAIAAGDGLGVGGGRVAALLSSGDVAVVGATGEVLARWSPGSEPGFGAGGFLATGDMDRVTDGILELVVVGREGTVIVLDAATGSYAPGHWPVELDARVAGAPALGDVDGDGRLEILVPLEEIGVGVLRSNGVPLHGSPWQAPLSDDASPLVVDLEGDGMAEVVVNASNGLAYGFRGDGSAVPGWPLGIGRGPLAAAAIVNLRTDDDEPELAMLDGIGAFGLVAMLGWEDAGTIAWAQSFGDGARRARFDAPIGVPQTPSVFASESGVYIYPNPARDENPRIRMELGADVDALIRIYSLGGNEVTTWRGRLASPVDEFEWDVRSIASGLYIARIELSGAGEEASFTRKIAVIR